MSAPSLRGTGPQGHRARMRARVLANGASTLADYEVLEMLLFHGIPRRDTKPLAKSLIQHFGSLTGVFRAPTHRLRDTGLADDVIRVLRFPAIAAERLASAEARERPVLGNWEQLLAYLDQAMSHAVPGLFRILYLDNRNRLLADEPVKCAEISEVPVVFRRALALHATALVGVTRAPGAPMDAATEGTGFSRALAENAAHLSIVFHDAVVVSDEDPVSLRQEGLL